MNKLLLDQRLYQHIEDRGLDKNTRIMSNRSFTIMERFWHIITFACVRSLLEPLRPLVTFLQRKVAEVLFGLEILER